MYQNYVIISGYNDELLSFLKVAVVGSGCCGDVDLSSAVLLVNSPDCSGVSLGSFLEGYDGVDGTIDMVVRSLVGCVGAGVLSFNVCTDEVPLLWMEGVCGRFGVCIADSVCDEDSYCYGIYRIVPEGGGIEFIDYSSACDADVRSVELMDDEAFDFAVGRCASLVG